MSKCQLASRTRRYIKPYYEHNHSESAHPTKQFVSMGER